MPAVLDLPVVSQLLKLGLRVAWPGYFRAGNQHAMSVVARAFWNQRVLRRNSHVPWPVHPTTVVRMPRKIERGERTPGLAPGCYLDGRNGIVFGRNVWVGPHVRVISMNHDPCDYHSYLSVPAIHIGDDCWIGAGAIILPGVELGAHTVVGAGAVVTRSFPEGNQLLAGNPAIVKKRLQPYAGTARVESDA